MKRFAQIGWSVFFLIVLGNLSLLSAAQSDSAGISGDIFGRKHGIIHPFLKVSETYSDNLTNSYIDEVSDWKTVISPGIALVFPGTGSTDVRMDSSTVAPGGLALSRHKLDTSNRYQGIVVYSPEITRYKDNSDENFTAQRVTGAFQYNAPGGLSIDIADKYQYAQEMWGETGDYKTDHATYADNVVHGIVDFAFSPKFSISAGGAYHTLEYKHDISEFRDRDDRVYSGALNFHLSTKTKLFCEYKRIDVRYDVNEFAQKDSTEDFVYGGVTWDITAKSQGTCKFGYVTKDFDAPGVDEESTWAGEIDITHKITDRTLIMASAVRTYYETNTETANFYTTNRVDLAYHQAFTPKVSLRFLLSYQNDDYDGIALENDTYRIRPAIVFTPYQWLSCELAYRYSDRTSDLDTWEYTTNEYTASIKASF